MPRWRVDLKGPSLHHIATIEANPAKEAVAAIAKLFHIERYETSS